MLSNVVMVTVASGGIGFACAGDLILAGFMWLSRISPKYPLHWPAKRVVCQLTLMWFRRRTTKRPFKRRAKSLVVSPLIQTFLNSSYNNMDIFDW